VSYNRGKNMILTLVPSASRGATFNSDGSGIFGNFDELFLFLDVTVVASTGTIQVNYQVSFDQGATWQTHTAMTISAGVSQRSVKVTGCCSYGRVNCVYAGAGNVTFAVYADLKKVG